MNRLPVVTTVSIFLLIVASSIITAIVVVPMPSSFGQTSRETWRYTTGDSVFAVSPIKDISGDGFDDIVAGSEDHTVYAIDGISGKKLWSSVTNQSINWIVTQPSMALVAGDESVFLLNGQDGKLKWRFDVAPADKEASCPSITIRSIFLASDVSGDGVHDAIVVSSSSGQTLQCSGSNSSDHDRFTVTALDVSDGGRIWQYEHGEDNHVLKEGVAGSSPVSVTDLNGDGVLDIAVIDSFNFLYVIDGLNGSGEDISNSTKLHLNGIVWNLVAVPDISGDKVGDAIAFEFVEGGGGPDYARVTALNLKSASKIWSVGIGDGTVHSGAVFSGTFVNDYTGDGKPDVVVTSRLDDKVSAMIIDGSNGEESGIFVLGTDNSRNDMEKHYPVIRAGDVDGDGVSDVAFASTSTVHLLNGRTGEIEWSQQVKSPIAMAVTSAADRKNEIVVGTDDSFVHALALVLGTDTSLTISISADSVEPSTRLMVSGAISPVLSGEVVEVQYVMPGGGSITRNVIVGRDGRYGDTINPDRPGQWSVSTEFHNKGNYIGSKSASLAFTVESALEDVYTLKMGDNANYTIPYNIDGGKVTAMAIDAVQKSLKIGIEPGSGGNLQIELPRTVIDTGKTGYTVMVDGKARAFSEIRFNNDSRTLSVPFDPDSKEITVIGTSVVPEFPIAHAAMAVAASIMIIVAIIGRSKLLGCHMHDNQ